MLESLKPEKFRKHSCFVCGFLFQNLEEMKAHIIEKHDENRDYIICPVEWCAYPIRDLKSHFKSKHPHLKIPSTPLNKAIVWRDFNEKKGKRTLKPKFRSGEYFSKKNQKEFHYRSGLECKLLEILEELPQVIKYDVEPFHINYTFNGSHHKYTPDLSILYENNSIEIIEIKPMNQTDLDLNKAKWTAAEGFCQARGWKFNVITEKGINKLKANLKKL